MDALPCDTAPNEGSIVNTSGSLKYTDGWLKSRGGVDTTVGGATGPFCPRAIKGIAAAKPI
jgi:hypothetical protein